MAVLRARLAAAAQVCNMRLAAALVNEVLLMTVEKGSENGPASAGKVRCLAQSAHLWFWLWLGFGLGVRPAPGPVPGIGPVEGKPCPPRALFLGLVRFVFSRCAQVRFIFNVVPYMIAAVPNPRSRCHELEVRQQFKPRSKHASDVLFGGTQLRNGAGSGARA